MSAIVVRICDYDPIPRSHNNLERKEGKLLRPPVPWRIAALQRIRKHNRARQASKQSDVPQ